MHKHACVNVCERQAPLALLDGKADLASQPFSLTKKVTALKQSLKGKKW